jgi:hypothetical protein
MQDYITRMELFNLKDLAWSERPLDSCSKKIMELLKLVIMMFSENPKENHSNQDSKYPHSVVICSKFWIVVLFFSTFFCWKYNIFIDLLDREGQFNASQLHHISRLIVNNAPVVINFAKQFDRYCLSVNQNIFL